MATSNILNTFEKQTSKRVPTNKVGSTEEKTNGGPNHSQETTNKPKATKRSLDTNTIQHNPV